MFTAYRSKSEIIRSRQSSFPLPQNTFPARHKVSIITRPQAAKILALLQSQDDKLKVQRELLYWNEMTAEEQFTYSAQGVGKDETFELELDSDGCSISLTLFPLEEHQINLLMDSDTDIVIKEVAL